MEAEEVFCCFPACFDMAFTSILFEILYNNVRYGKKSMLLQAISPDHYIKLPLFFASEIGKL